MKAVFKTRPEPGVEIKEVDEPKLLHGEVLVEVSAAGICGTDLHTYKWTPSRYNQLRLPLIIGHEFSGSIAEIKDESPFQVGDKVTVTPHVYCKRCYYCISGRGNLCEEGALKIGFTKNGAFAKYVSVPNECVYKLPDKVTVAEAALTEPFCTALHAVGSSSFKCGDVAAVLGPGPIGILLLIASESCRCVQGDGDRSKHRWSET